MTLPHPTRRGLLAAAGGVSLTFLARQSFAAGEGDQARRKLVVVICRGAMDGLSVSPPIGDRDYAGLRGAIAIAPEDALRLDDTFALHPRLESVHAMALRGEARIAPAIATPDRARSHFEAQDMLESGSANAYGAETGWLNRAVESLRAARKVDAISVGPSMPLILRGRVEAASWSPGGEPSHNSRLPVILTDLYAADPLLSAALASGLATESMASEAMAAARADRMLVNASTDPAGGQGMSGAAGGRASLPGVEEARRLGATLAKFMIAPGGPQIAAMSLDGFDTHAGQGAAVGALANRLAALDGVLDALSTGLGPEWRNTTVVVATEFGRTARVNGTGGTDHGTASTALLLGGGLKRGGLIGDWPTLQPARLFEARDTAPTVDMRALFKGVLAEQLGVDRRALDATIFPGSAAVAPVTGLIAA